MGYIDRCYNMFKEIVYTSTIQTYVPQYLIIDCSNLYKQLSNYEHVLPIPSSLSLPSLPSPFLFPLPSPLSLLSPLSLSSLLSPGGIQSDQSSWVGICGLSGSTGTSLQEHTTTSWVMGVALGWAWCVAIT